jgi:hypothetical protein
MAQNWVQLPDPLPDVILPPQGGGAYARVGDSVLYEWQPDHDVQPVDQGKQFEDVEHIRPTAGPDRTVKPVTSTDTPETSV